MPGVHTKKEKRMAKHIMAGYKKKGASKKRAEKIAWATVNKLKAESWMFNGAGQPVFIGNPNVSQFDPGGSTSPGNSYVPDEVAKMIIREAGLRKGETLSKKVITGYLQSMGLSDGLAVDVAKVLRDVYGVTPTFDESVEESFPMPFAFNEDPKILNESDFVALFLQREFLESKDENYKKLVAAAATIPPDQFWDLAELHAYLGSDVFEYLEMALAYGRDGLSEEILNALLNPHLVEGMSDEIRSLINEDTADEPIRNYLKFYRELAEAGKGEAGKSKAGKSGSGDVVLARGASGEIELAPSGAVNPAASGAVNPPKTPAGAAGKPAGKPEKKQAGPGTTAAGTTAAGTTAAGTTASETAGPVTRGGSPVVPPGSPPLNPQAPAAQGGGPDPRSAEQIAKDRAYRIKLQQASKAGTEVNSDDKLAITSFDINSDEKNKEQQKSYLDRIKSDKNQPAGIDPKSGLEPPGSFTPATHSSKAIADAAAAEKKAKRKGMLGRAWAALKAAPGRAIKYAVRAPASLIGHTIGSLGGAVVQGYKDQMERGKPPTFSDIFAGFRGGMDAARQAKKGSETNSPDAPAAAPAPAANSGKKGRNKPQVSDSIDYSIYRSGSLISEISEDVLGRKDSWFVMPHDIAPHFEVSKISDIAILEAISEMDWDEVATIAQLGMLESADLLSLLLAYRDDHRLFYEGMVYLEESGSRPGWLSPEIFHVLSNHSLDENIVPRIIYWAGRTLQYADQDVSFCIRESYPELGDSVYGPAGDPKEGPEMAKAYMQVHAPGAMLPSDDALKTNMFASKKEKDEIKAKKFDAVMAALNAMELAADVNGVPPEGMFLNLYRDMHRDKIRYTA